VTFGSATALIGIDLGTSSIKVAAFDPTGRILALRRGETPTWRGPRGWAEHDPDALWAVTLDLLRRVREELAASTDVAAIACTSVGEAGVAVDATGRPVRPAIAWFDSRSGDQVAYWEGIAGMAAINRITGQPVDPHYGVNKLLWIRQHEPAAFAATRKWLSLADYLVLRLCGAYATDRSLAARTMLFDQRRLTWSTELLALAGLDAELMPAVDVGGTRIGGLLPAVAGATGLTAGTPIALAGHDRLCGAFAARGSNDMAVDSTGSAEAIVLPVETYVERSAEEAGFVSCYADVVPGQYIFSARVGYAGALVDWLRRELLGAGDRKDDSIGAPELDALIPLPLRYSGLLVYPSFGRALAPLWNPAAKGGAILGLTLAHGRGHIYQAILEGICFSLRNRLDWLEQLTNRPIARLRVEGGAVRSPIWMQLKADVSGRPLEAVQMEEPTALGAALLAGVAVGIYGSHAEASAAVSADIGGYTPEPQRRDVYDGVYRTAFRRLPDIIASLAVAPAGADPQS
jgi:xylulokinase